MSLPTRLLSSLLVGVLLAAPARAHSPHDIVQELALSPAFAVDRTMFAAVTLSDHHFFARSLDAGRSWELRGLPMMQVAINDFAFSPDFLVDGTAFCATNNLGVYRTTDHGQTWEPVILGLVSLSVRGVSVSPFFAQDGLVVAATASGCFRSTDGGSTWAPANTGLLETNLTMVRFAPVNAQPTVFVTGKNLYRSDNGGLSFTIVGAFAFPVDSLALSPSFESDGTMAVCFGRYGGGIQLTQSSGVQWDPWITGLSDLFVYNLAFASTGVSFAATKTSGAFRADGPGLSWSLGVEGLEPNSPLTQVHWTELAISPAFATDNLVYLGAYEGLFISRNAGHAWRQSNLYDQRFNRHVRFSPNYSADCKVFFGNYGGGVFLYVDVDKDLPVSVRPESTGLVASPEFAAPGITPAPGGVASSGGAPSLTALPHWKTLSNNLPTLWADALAASPNFAVDQTLFYGFFGLFVSPDAGKTWNSVNLPPSVSVARAIAPSPAFATDAIVFVGTSSEGTFISANGCESWQRLEGGLPDDLDATRILCSPGFASDQTVFLASRAHGLWKTVDAGQSWTPTPVALTNSFVRAMAISPNFVGDGVVFAGTVGDGLLRSQDGGATWALSNAGLPRDVPLIVEAVECSPAFASDQTVFLATLNEGVFKSMDGGLSWAPAGMGLPATAPPRSLAISPAYSQDQTVIVSTFDWAWVSRDAGLTWKRLSGAIRADESHPSVHVTGTWLKSASNPNHGAAVEIATTPGAYQEIEFFGRSIRWFGNRRPDGGIASVKLDNEPAIPVDMFSPTISAQEPLFQRTFAQPGWHVLRVTSTGNTHPQGGGNKVATDGFLFEF
ncbi:MAG: hypothetical protein ACT4PU_07465 [Planctomycetota bacterium]